MGATEAVWWPNQKVSRVNEGTKAIIQGVAVGGPGERHQAMTRIQGPHLCGTSQCDSGLVELRLPGSSTQRGPALPRPQHQRSWNRVLSCLALQRTVGP